MLAAQLIDKDGTAQNSPSHNTYKGNDAAGFFLLAQTFALSKGLSAVFTEVDGFKGTTGWTIAIGDDTFNWNVSGHAGHATRNSTNLSFSSDELTAMLAITDEGFWESLKTLDSDAALKPWLRAAELIDNHSESNHATIT